MKKMKTHNDCVTTMILVPLKACPTSQNLGHQFQIGVVKNLIVEEASQTTTLGPLNSRAHSKLPQLTDYLECIW